MTCSVTDDSIAFHAARYRCWEKSAGEATAHGRDAYNPEDAAEAFFVDLCGDTVAAPDREICVCDRTGATTTWTVRSSIDNRGEFGIWARMEEK